MRYIAKVHVLDVMDQIVVSGYVYDADPLTDPDHEPTEFTYSVPGRGVSEPLSWLMTSLYAALMQAATPARKGATGAVADGGTHTLSETGDSRSDVMG